MVPLIFPFYVAYRPLDLDATDTAGYDHVFREPEVVDDGSQLGVDARTESAEVRVPAQIEEKTFEQLNFLQTGDSPKSTFVLVHHFNDLTTLGLVDSDGMATIKKGDRVVAIYEKYSGDKVFDAPDPPGLFVTEVLPKSFGLGHKRNLLLVTLGDREQGVE